MSWTILRLPAIDEQGQSLWPDYFPIEKLEETRRSMGSALFACMYLGRPEALSGDIFERQWFVSCRLGATPEGMFVQTHDGKKLKLEDLLVYQYFDLALSAKETADYTVCLTLALDPATMQLYVLDVTRGHWSFHETQEQIARLGEFWSPMVIGIEQVAYQAAAVQEAIRNTLLPIRAVKPDHDKVTRARLPAALAESGKVEVVEALWNEDFYEELLAFPNALHDDMVDALSGACALAAAYVPTRMYLWGGD